MPRTFCLLLLFAGLGWAQLDALRAEIRALYQPVDLKTNSDLARAGRFFAQLRNHSKLAQYLEALRAELDDGRPSSRMRANATNLLLLLSDTPENQAFAARMLPRIDLWEVEMFEYYTLLQRLGRNNVDVSLAAFRLLERPNVRLELDFVPGFSFDQASLVAALLLPISEEYWTTQAIERLASESDATAQQTLLRLVWYAQTDFGDSELAHFAADPTKPGPSRALASELIARTLDLGSADLAEVAAYREDELRERRRLGSTGIYIKTVIPTIERDTMKILLKRRLTASQQ